MEGAQWQRTFNANLSASYNRPALYVYSEWTRQKAEYEDKFEGIILLIYLMTV